MKTILCIFFCSWFALTNLAVALEVENEVRLKAIHGMKRLMLYVAEASLLCAMDLFYFIILLFCFEVKINILYVIILNMLIANMVTRILAKRNLSIQDLGLGFGK